MTWNVDLDSLGLSDDERKQAQQLLELSSDPPTLDQIWAMMDQVWDECGCDNRVYDPDRYAEFYHNVVWVLNGLFTEINPESRQNRQMLADWLKSCAQREELHRLADYGGGFGFLARLIAEQLPSASVDVLEPYPHPVALDRSRNYSNLRFVSEPQPPYDALISLDVLEHVPDPMQTLAEMRAAVRPGGLLLLGHCFYPVIKCHLPEHFHLRYGFPWAARRMGLVREGSVGGGYIQIFRRTSDEKIDWPGVRAMENHSRRIFPLLRALAIAYHGIHGRSAP